jgi:uracil-DNA glycosylase family 4
MDLKMSDNWDDEFFTCAGCGTDKCVSPSGSLNSPFLIIGSYPADDEIKDGLPFTGKTGGVLKAELRRAGLDYSQFRVTNLWKHIPNKNPKCLEDGAQSAIAEAKGKKLILLIGAEAVKFFCGVSVEGYNGLMTQSNYLSAPVMICIQPTTVFHGGIGEIRQTISKLSQKIEEIIKC